MGVIRVFLLLAVVSQCLAEDVKRFVTCGSAIKLRHINSGKYFLKSSTHNFGSSGQKVVTLDVNAQHGDVNLLWQIREAHNTTACATGVPVKCGDVIRLTHVKTGKNLHSHHELPAPLSRFNNEVSGFGNDGQGDDGDNWQVECMHRKGAEKMEKLLWESDGPVRFQHVDTGRWLSSSTRMKFNQSNCPHCPIHGELEVSGTDRNSDAAIQSTIFRADDGAYVRL